MQNKKIIFISILIVSILLAGSLVAYKLLKSPNVAETGEADDLIKDNQKVVADANGDEMEQTKTIDDADHILGKLGAPVELIVYGDFECSFCSSYAATIKQAQAEFGDDIAIAFRHYILRSHPYAMDAALASECAAEQGKFWEMYDLLYQDQKENKLNIEEYKTDAKVLQLDEEKFSQCLETEKYKDKIMDQWTEAKKFGVSGTPASFLNLKPLPGAVPYEDYQGSDGQMKTGLKNLISAELGDRQ